MVPTMSPDDSTITSTDAAPPLVDMSSLRALRTLIREARAERDAAPEPIEQVVEGRRGRSTWRGGLLHQLDVDTDWLRRASKQAISEEFMTLLARPDAPDTTPTPAQDRLARFVKEYA